MRSERRSSAGVGPVSAGADSTGEAVGDTADGWMRIETRLGAGTASGSAGFFWGRARTTRDQRYESKNGS